MMLEPAHHLKIRKRKQYLIAVEGVLIHGDHMIPGADRFVRLLNERGVRFLLLTNNSRRTPQNLAENLQTLGVPVSAKHIYTSAMATARFLRSQKPGGSAYVIGENGLLSAIHEVNFAITEQNPDFVVLGGAEEYDFDQITKAINFITKGAHFICTNPDPNGQSKNGLTPASGAMAALIVKATKAIPFFIGKPNPFMMRSALNFLGLHSKDTIMVGDQMDTDIIAGLESGMETILVLSGGSTPEDLSRFAYRPNHLIRSIADLEP